MIDYTDASPDTIESVLLRQWIIMSSSGLYDAFISFKDPKTSEVKTLNTLDAFIYMYYITLRSIGLELVSMPEYINIKERKIIKPSLEYMLRVTDKSFIDLKEIGLDLLSKQPDITNVYSNTSFFNLSYSIYEELQRCRFLVSFTEDYYKRALVQNMILTLYEDKSIVFPSSTNNINEWLFNNGLDQYNYTQSEAKELITSIFTSATGLVIDETKLVKNIQRALIAIFSQLTSYTTQFITEINLSKIKPLNWAAIRLGNIKNKSIHNQFVEVDVRCLDYKGLSKQRVILNSLIEQLKIKLISNKTRNVFFIRISSNYIYLIRKRREIDLFFNGIDLSAFYLGKLVNDNNSGFLGIENYDNLTNDQKLQLKHIY
jgi:hypothetical protein